MDNNSLIEAICEMVMHIHNNDSLKRIYNLIVYLLRNDKAD